MARSPRSATATAWPVLPAVFSKVMLSASKPAPLIFDGLGEEGAAGDAGIEAVGDDDVVGRVCPADEGDVGVVLGDDDALVVVPGTISMKTRASFPFRDGPGQGWWSRAIWMVGNSVAP
jgi:hypothetical protein